MPIKTLIMGAAGRDFHNFNTFFRGNKDYEVVAFTATQIPDIEGRLYPVELAGELYPGGIPIRAASPPPGAPSLQGGAPHGPYSSEWSPPIRERQRVIAAIDDDQLEDDADEKRD